MGLMKNIAISRNFKGFDFKLNEVDIANLEKKLEGLDQDVKKRISMKALRAGGKIYILEVKRRSTSDRVAAGVRGVTKTVRGVKGYLAGPSAGFPNPAWLEYGTFEKYVGYGKGKGQPYVVRRSFSFQSYNGEWVTFKAGKTVMRGIRPRPFIQPSFDTKYPAMINKISEVVGKEIEKHGR